MIIGGVQYPKSDTRKKKNQQRVLMNVFLEKKLKEKPKLLSENTLLPEDRKSKIMTR